MSVDANRLIEWDASNKGRFGLFSLQRFKNGAVSISLPVFDAEFHSMAKSSRARWRPADKSWQFTEKQLDALLPKLAAISSRREAEFSKQEEGVADAKSEMEAAAWQFHVSRGATRVSYINDEGVFRMRFPYHPPSIERIRTVRGAAWNPREKTWDIPLAGKRLVDDMLSEAVAADAKRAADLLSFVELEKIDPLEIPPTPPFGFQCSFNKESMTYEMGCKGLAKNDFLTEVFWSRVPPELTERSQSHGAPFSVCEVKSSPTTLRTPVSNRSAVKAIIDGMTELSSSFQKAETFDLVMRARDVQALYDRNSRSNAPQGGDVVIVNFMPRLVIRAKKSRQNDCSFSVEAIPISAAEAKKRLAPRRLNDSTAKDRCCALSGIDAESFQAYIEAIELRETSATATNPAAPLSKPSI